MVEHVDTVVHLNITNIGHLLFGATMKVTVMLVTARRSGDSTRREIKYLWLA
jgi:hypothetical protein